MQSHSRSSPEHDTRGGWQTLRSLIPYLMEFKGRVIVAMSLLILAKLANVAVPLVFKQIIDSIDNNLFNILTLPLTDAGITLITKKRDERFRTFI